MTDNKQITAIALVLTLLVSGIGLSAMATLSEGTEEETETYTQVASYGSGIGDAYQTLAGVGSGICVFLGDAHKWQAEFWYGLANDGVHGGEIETTDSDVAENLRAGVLTTLTEDGSVLYLTGANLLASGNDVWGLSTAYCSRATEISAAQEWGEGAVYYPNDIVSAGGVYELMGTYAHNIYTSLDWAVAQQSDRIDSWASSDTYSGIVESLVFDGGSTSAVSGESATAFTHYVSLASATSSNNVVYLDTTSSSTVWAMQGGEIMTLNGTVVATLTEGANTVSTSLKGFYKLSEGVYGAQGFLPSLDSAATVVGGLVLEVNDGSDATYGYVTVNDDDDLAIVYNGTSYTSSYLKYRYTSDGSNFDLQTVSGSDPIASMVTAIDGMISEMSDVLDTASTSGRTMWTIMSSAGESCLWLSPSSVSSLLVEQGISAEQSTALYINALSQMSEYYTAHQEVIDSTEVKVSAESLTTYCLATTIYNADGTVVAEDVICTPYVYLANQKLTTDGYTVLDQISTVMIWTDEGMDSLDGFEFSDTPRTVVLPAGCYLEIEEMSVNGESASEVTLKVKEVSEIAVLSDIASRNVESVKVLSADSLVSAIMILAGLCLVLVYFAGVRSFYIILAGVVVAAIGIFAPQMVSELLVGWFGR